MGRSPDSLIAEKGAKVTRITQVASESEQIRHLEEMNHRLNLQLGAANRHAAASAAFG